MLALILEPIVCTLSLSRSPYTYIFNMYVCMYIYIIWDRAVKSDRIAWDPRTPLRPLRAGFAMWCSHLPSSLLSLTFCYAFNRSLEGSPLPSSLRSLAFGYAVNRSLEGSQLPSSLRSLAFGYAFNRSLESSQLPCSVQSLLSRCELNQSLERTQLSSSTRSLTFGCKARKAKEQKVKDLNVFTSSQKNEAGKPKSHMFKEIFKMMPSTRTHQCRLWAACPRSPTRSMASLRAAGIPQRGSTSPKPSAPSTTLLHVHETVKEAKSTSGEYS